MSPVVFKYLGVVIALLALIGGSYFAGYNAGSDTQELKCSKERELLAKDALDLQKQIQDLQSTHAQQVAKITDDLHEEIQNVQERSSSIIDDLRNGNLRLRDELKATSKSNVSKACTSSKGDDDTGDAIVSRKNQELLLQIGKEADDVRARLTSCQNYVKNLLENWNEKN